MPAHQPGDFAEENDLLATYPSVETEVMLQTLEKTSSDISEIAAEVKNIIHQMNNSTGLWSMLNDKSIPNHIKASVSNMHEAAYTVNAMTRDLSSIITDVKNGEGSVGALLTDTSYAQLLDNGPDFNDVHHFSRRFVSIHDAEYRMKSTLDATSEYLYLKG